MIGHDASFLETRTPFINDNNAGIIDIYEHKQHIIHSNPDLILIV